MFTTKLLSEWQGCCSCLCPYLSSRTNFESLFFALALRVEFDVVQYSNYPKSGTTLMRRGQRVYCYWLRSSISLNDADGVSVSTMSSSNWSQSPIVFTKCLWCYTDTLLCISYSGSCSCREQTQQLSCRCWGWMLYRWLLSADLPWPRINAIYTANLLSDQASFNRAMITSNDTCI